MVAKLSPSATIKLSDNRELPIIGFGTSGLDEGEQAENAVHWALDAGYRHIDTARLYGNEMSVGKAVRDHKINREDVWVTTKLWPTDFSNPQKALEASLKRLDIGYIDLYLIHWPTPVEIPGFDNKLWRTMESLRDQNLCKSIGVSNFQTGRLKKLLSKAQTPPVVNQVECSPFHYPKQLHDFCSESNIVIVGYSPLNEGEGLANTVLQTLAEKYDKTPAQIMLHWAVQKGIVPIPKSKSQERIIENLNIFDFEIAQEDMNALDILTS